MNKNKKQKNKASGNKTKGKTPYQGKKKCFGEYKCPECDRYWASAHSWANKGQECLDCGTNVYPFKQIPLRRGKKCKGVNRKKPHRADLCQKCEELGFHCTKVFEDVNNKIQV